MKVKVLWGHELGARHGVAAEALMSPRHLTAFSSSS